MNAKRERLARVLKVRTLQERLCITAFAEAQRDVSRLEEEIAELRAERVGLSERIRAERTGVVDVRAGLLSLDLASRLSEWAEALRASLAGAMRALASARTSMLDARGERRGIELLLERERAVLEQAAGRREARAIDDVARERHVRAQAGG